MRLNAPRFETEAEKLERLRMERELAEFGEVSEAFRLSRPNPRQGHCQCCRWSADLLLQFCTGILIILTSPRISIQKK